MKILDENKLSIEQREFIYRELKANQIEQYNRLSADEKKAFWGLEKRLEKENFLGASPYDRSLFMNNKLNVEEAAIFKKEGGSKKMRIISEGQVLHARIKKFSAYRKYFVGVVLALLAIDVYCNTFVKASQLQNIAGADGETSVHYVVNKDEIGKIDNESEIIGITTKRLETTKTLDGYQHFISIVVDPKSMQCDPIGSLEESFMNSKTHLADEVRCKVDGENVWVESYVQTGAGQIKPVFGVFHQFKDKEADGVSAGWKYENFDLGSYKIDTAKILGLPTVSEKDVPKAFAHAFPEAMVDGSTVNKKEGEE